MLVPLATERRPGSVLGRRLGRRPSHSLSVSARTIHDRRALSESVDEEAASGVSVQRRERAVRGGQSFVTRTGLDTECGEGPGNRVQANPAPPSVWSTSGDWGKAKHVDVQYLWIQEASKSGRFVTKKVGTNVNPADLMTKQLPGPKIEQAEDDHGLRVCRAPTVNEYRWHGM